VWFSDNNGGSWYHSGITFTIIDSPCGSSGGGGDTATSTQEQVQQNIYNAIVIFCISFAIIFWILKTT